MTRFAIVLAVAGLASADRAAEECEACGLLVWRMQTIVAAKAAKLDKVKKAKEKRAAKSSKAHSRRWLKQVCSRDTRPRVYTRRGCGAG